MLAAWISTSAEKTSRTCSVNDTPDVWLCVRSRSDLGFFGLNFSCDRKEESGAKNAVIHAWLGTGMWH